MIAGGNATLLVSDMERAVRFYVETLGFKLRGRQGDAWAEVDGGDGVVLGLLPASARSPRPGTAGSIAVGLAVNQPLADVVSVLGNRGVVFHGPIRSDGPFAVAPFADPDGNALYLFEPKARSPSG